MFSDFRSRCGGVSRAVGILTLLATLALAGCTPGGPAVVQFAVTTTTLPAGSVTAGATYPSTTLVAAVGTAPYTWAVTSGNLPAGLTLSTSGTVSGTPTATGTFNFTVTVTDSSTPAKTTTANLSITINAKLAITSSGLLSTTGEVGGAFPSTPLAATGGVSPYTWAVNSGNLPAGLSLGSNGSITGTISSSATPGTYNFTAKVTDSQGGTAVSGTISITLDAALSITAPTLPTGVVSVNYSASAFTASGGSGTGYTFAVASGSLPAPLTLGASTGLISAGPPTTSGTFTFTVKVTDSLGYTATTGGLSITINPAISVTLNPAGPATLDQGKSQLVKATVSNDPNNAGVNWSAVTGSGTLSSSTATSTIYNAPASVTSAGSATFTATSKTDPTKSATFTVDLVPPPQITTTTMPAGNLNGTYNGTVTETGGVGPYTWAIVTAPAGLTLSSSTTNQVKVQGAPTVAGNNQTFTIMVTDAQGLSSTSTGLTITVYPTLTIAAPSLPLPTGVVGVSYAAGETFTASGGSGTYTAWAVVAGNPLPAGLSLSPTSGTTTSITGTPTASGTSSFKVQVTDSVGNVATSSAIPITINPAISVTLTPTGPVTLDQGKTQAVTANVSNDPSSAGVNWSAVTGLGTLTGSSTTATTYTAPASVTSASSATFTATSKTDPTKSATFTVNLVPPPQITTSSMPAGNLNGTYNAAVTETGGVGPYTWAIVAAPAGLTLSSSTTNQVTVQGAPTVAGNNQTFTIKVTDAQGLSATSTGLTITVYPTLSITTPSLPLPTGVVGVNYPSSETFAANGGSGTGYTWSVVAGNPLPPGLNLSATSGSTTAITAGPPTTGGTYPFTIKLTDSVGNAATTSGLSITINPPITVGFTPSSPLTMDQNTTQSITANVSNDPLSAGVTWSAVTGLGTLSGSTTTTTTYNAPATVTTNSSATFTATSVTDPSKSATFTVNLVPPPSIGSVTFPAGTVGSAYDTTVTETGGVGPFTWAAVALPAGMSLSSSTTSSVVVQGTPTTAGANQTVTIKVTDAKGLTNTLNSTVSINPAITCTTNCQISGSVTGAWGQDVTITLSGQGTGSTTTSATGSYSFSGLTPGNYTITPSLTGYTYSPTSISVDVVGNTTGQNFVASSAMTSYSISGTITYSGAQTGKALNTIIRVMPSNCTGCGTVAGASITSVPTSSGTAYTVRGLPSTNGNGYIVQAEIDTLGTGITNESNPEGTSNTVTLPNTDATGINFAIVDRTPSAPQMPPQNQFSVSPASGTAIIQYRAPLDNNGEEIATSYNVYYSVNDFATSLGPVSFKAEGNNTNVFILSGLVNGTAYQFKISAVNSVGESAKTSPVSATPTAVGTAGPYSVSGKVTYPVTPTGPLYVGVYGSNGVYVDVISSPPANGTGGVAYTITGVPAGTYQNFAIIDMNKDGEIDTGDITDVNSHGNPPTITVTSSNLTNQNLTLTSYTATPAVNTFVQGSSGQPDSYSLNLQISNETKLPISMTLFSGKNVAVPYDMSADQHNSNESPLYNNSVSPSVGDNYQFLVTFSDGTTSIISAPITAVLSSSFAGNLAMNSPVSNTTTVPVLNWTAPTTAPTITPYTYNVSLNNQNGPQENWYYSGSNNGNGLPSTTTHVQFDTDGSANPSSSLTPGDTYNWSVTVIDNDNNSAQYSTTYTVPGSSIQSPTISVAFNPTSIATGGNSTLTFTINNPNSSNSLSGIAFTDNLTCGLQATGSSSSNNCGGTFTGTGAGSTSVSLSNAGLSAGGSCQLTIQVTSNGTGTINNTTGNISSNEAGTGSTSNTATLTVGGGSGVLPPTISIAFNPSTIQVDFSTTLTFTINNPNGSNSLSGVAFTDNLPSNLFVLSPNNGLTGSCGSGTITATAGSSTISLSGGTLGAGGSCNFSVNVTATATGTINDTTGNITSNEGGTGGTSNTASLTVNSGSSSSPTINSNNSDNFFVAVPETFTVSANGNPTPSLSVTGALPTGVTFTDNGNGTGSLQGTPASGTAGNYTPTFTASNGVGSNATQSFSLTVTSLQCPLAALGNESLLNGTFVALYNGFNDANGPSQAVMVFVANGSGGITSGEMDFGTVLNYTGSAYTTPNAPQNSAISSSGSCYQLGSDGRGFLVLKQGSSTIVTFAIAARSNGALGRLIEFDDVNPSTTTTGGRGSGVFMKRTISGPFSASSLNGSFALGLAGFNNDNCTSGTSCGSSGDLGYQRLAAVGRFTSNGAGSISSFVFDVAQVNGGSTPAQANIDSVTPTSASYTAPDSLGRGTLTMSGNDSRLGGAFTVDFAYYLIDATHFYLQSIDSPTNDPLFNGEAIGQTGSFSVGSLNGKALFSLTGGDVAANAFTVTAAGQVSGAGTGSNVSTLMDKESDGTTVSTGTAAITGGTFSVSSNGMGDLTIGSGGSAAVFSVAMTGTNSGFLLEGSQASPGVNVMFGSLEAQTAPGGGWSASAFSGLYAYDDDVPSTPYAKVGVGSLTATPGSPTNNVSGESNKSQGISCGDNCLTLNNSLSATYTVDTNGRITVTTSGGTDIGWLRDTTHGVLVGSDVNGLTTQLDH
jgi:hypothetical protein